MPKSEPQTIEQKLDLIILQQSEIIDQQREIVEKLDNYGIDVGRATSFEADPDDF